MTAMFAIFSSVISCHGWVSLASNSCHCSQVIPDSMRARQTIQVGPGMAAGNVQERAPASVLDPGVG
jgi:hypothetical protein